MALKTDFKDDIFEGNRKYKLSQDGTGNTEIQDVTVYSQEGDPFTAEHINATNEAVNGLSEDMVDLKKSVSDGKAQVAAAITAKRVPTAATATFGEMAANIGKIVLGSGNAVPSDVLAGKTFTNNDGVEYTGTMPNRGDYNGWGNSKGNDADNQRMWVKIPQGYYNENANVFLSWADIRNMAGITADKIKKGESIMGIIGSWEGYVPLATDIYYNGANPYGLAPVSSVTLENTYISCGMPYPGQAELSLNHSFNFSNYNRAVMELTYLGPVTGGAISFKIYGTTSGGVNKLYTGSISNPPLNQKISIAVDLPDKTIFNVKALALDHSMTSGGKSAKIHRIRFE